MFCICWIHSNININEAFPAWVQKTKAVSFSVLLMCFLLISSWFRLLCKRLSASCWSQREQKYRCSVNQGCSACATAEKVAPESAAVLGSLHQPCRPSPHTFNHSSPQTVAGMWFGLRLLPSPESQQFAGSGQTAALQTTPCSEQPRVHKRWNADTVWMLRQPPGDHSRTRRAELPFKEKTSERTGRQTESITEWDTDFLPWFQSLLQRDKSR